MFSLVSVQNEHYGTDTFIATLRQNQVESKFLIGNFEFFP